MSNKHIVLATANPGKVKEIKQLLRGVAINVSPQMAFSVPEIEETGLTFIENALLKARNVAIHTDLPAIADDSGLVVGALNGAPGIRSARYAGSNATNAENISKLVDAIRLVPEEKRAAYFICVMVYLRYADDPDPIITKGVWQGNILTEPQGARGFGYDPIFWVPTHQCSSAQLSPEVKNQLSHRGHALRSLVKKLRP